MSDDKNDKQKKGKIVLFVMVGLLALSLILSGISSLLEKNVDKEEFFPDKNSSLNFVLGKQKNQKPIMKKIRGSYIAILHIEGVIQKEGKTYDQKWLLDTINNLKDDEKNKGILLFIDSPGGTVYESDEAYLALIDYKNATNRPVYAYFASLAASGGYYIASSSDYIFANRNTLTGSIGVIAGQSMDATGLMEKLGIKSRTFTAGRNKNMMNYNEPLSEEQAEIMQSIADDAYEQFTSIVATARKMDIEDVKKIADGRIYTANQALKVGLIDKICSLEEARDYIDDAFGSKMEFEDFKFEYEESLRDIFGFVSSFIKNPKAEMKLNYLY